MSTKQSSDCLHNAADDEPIFVLRAQDKLAPDVIRMWAAEARKVGVPATKVLAALDLAARMECWAVRKFPD